MSNRRKFDKDRSKGNANAPKQAGSGKGSSDAANQADQAGESHGMQNSGSINTPAQPDSGSAALNAPIQPGPIRGAKTDAFQAKVEYQRARWKHGMRIFGIVMMILLNVSLVMSDIERAQKFARFSIPHELITYLALLLLDTTVLLPLLLEVDKIEVYNDSILLKAIFWKSKLKWEDIQYFKLPPMLKFAILRSQKCLYLINKRDIKNFTELAASIVKHQGEFKLKAKT